MIPFNEWNSEQVKPPRCGNVFVSAEITTFGIPRSPFLLLFLAALLHLFIIHHHRQLRESGATEQLNSKATIVIYQNQNSNLNIKTPFSDS